MVRIMSSLGSESLTEMWGVFVYSFTTLVTRRKHRPRAEFINMRSKK